MYDGITYADEAYSESTRDKITVNFWNPVMRRGVILFPRPEECPVHKTAGEGAVKKFGAEYGNFIMESEERA